MIILCINIGSNQVRTRTKPEHYVRVYLVLVRPRGEPEHNVRVQVRCQRCRTRIEPDRGQFSVYSLIVL